MSFLRHKQIYRPMLLTSKRDSFATVPLSSSDESATGYSSASCTPAALACASPAFAIVKPIAGNRQPPLIQGWGIFTRRNGDFSAGVDRNAFDHLESFLR
jgi:hypothetical protein